MENDDPDAALVDSFFLPGGILDPESYEEEKAIAVVDSSFPASSQQPDPEQLLPTSTFTSFPPAINPNNPWAQTGTAKSSGTRKAGSDQSQSFFQSSAPFQTQLQQQAPTVTLHITSPPRIAVSSRRPPPGFQAPPGFEHASVLREISYTDDESIQSVPRELMQGAKSSYAESSTSSLSGSSVDGDDDDDEEEEDDGEEEAQDDDALLVRKNGDNDTEENSVQNEEAVNRIEDKNGGVAHEKSFEENATLLGGRQKAKSSWTDKEETIPLTPESNNKSIRTVQEENWEPVETSSPLSTKNVPDKDAPMSLPSQLKSKQRKRRGARRSKSQQSPVQDKEKEIATECKAEVIPVLEKKPATSKPKEKISKAIKRHDFWKESRIVIKTLTRALAIIISFSVALYRAALDEALGDTVALGSYLFFRYCPLVIGRVIVEISLPHWTSHLVTLVGVWQICAPARKDRTVVPLRLLRLAAVLGFVIDGFSQKHASIMMLPGTVRMLLVFLLMMTRGGYWYSPLLWFSLMVQILSTVVFPFDQILIILGLASLNYKRHLALKTAVLQAPKI